MVSSRSSCDRICSEEYSEEAVLGALSAKDGLRPARIHVPTGTVHAIGPGLLTFEISEQTQVTYDSTTKPRAEAGQARLDEGCRALMSRARTCRS